VQPLPFADILVRFITIDALVPLFAQLTLPSLDDLRPDPFIHELIDLFFNVLDLSRSVNPHLLSIVVYLLGLSPDCLTFDVYGQCLVRFHHLGLRSLQEEVFRKLILNPILWNKARAETILQVTAHWATQLPLDHLSLTFSEVLDIFVVVFWSENPPPKGIRENAVAVLVKVSKQRPLTGRDINSLIGHTKAQPHVERCVDLLCLVSKMALLGVFASVRKKWPRFTNLHYLLQFENEVITCQLLQTLAALHPHQLFPSISSLVFHVHVLVRILPKSLCGPMLLRSVLD
jgi:hypothetical protein